MIFFSIVLLLTSGTAIAQSENCDNKPCDSYTIVDLIQNLWSLATGVTPNGVIYRDIILNGLETSSTEKQQVSLAQSLWGYDAYTNFDFPRITCIYVNLIQKTIDYANNAATKQELNDAFAAYVDLCQNVINYAVEVSMIPTSCPYNLPTLVDNEPECSIAINVVNDYLQNNDLPVEMKDIIKDLIQSNNKKDRVLGYSALVTLTDKSKDLFKSWLEAKELVDAVRVKCCLEPVSAECCDHRRKIVVHRMKEVGLRLRQLLKLALQ